MTCDRFTAVAQTVIFLCCVLQSSARAEGTLPSCVEIPSCFEQFAEAQARAKSGDNEEALRRFQSLHVSYRDPRILYPIAVLLQRLGRAAEAATFFKNYLDSGVEANAVKIAKVEEQLRQVQQLMVPHALPPEHQVVVPKVDIPKSSVFLPPTNVGMRDPLTRPEKAFMPIHKRWWLWTMAGIASVGVSAGVGIWLFQRSTVSVYRPFE